MHEVRKDLVMRQNRVKHLSNLLQEVHMRHAKVVPGKHVMLALVLALKKVEIKAEDIPVHMHHKQTAKKKMKDKGIISTVMVYAV